MSLSRKSRLSLNLDLSMDILQNIDINAFELPSPHLKTPRKSLHSKKVSFLESSFVPENNDELEIQHRRRQSTLDASLPQIQLNSFDLNTSNTVQHYNDCLKLSAQNKITAKNAFSLQLIDYMPVMLKKNDQRLKNFQTASCMLDASTKIYASRVDRIHTDGFRIACGLGAKRQPQTDKLNDESSNNNEPAVKSQSKKKKKLKMRNFGNRESLNQNLEVNLCSDISFLYMKWKFGNSRPGLCNILFEISVSGETPRLMLSPNDNYIAEEQKQLSEYEKINFKFPSIRTSILRLEVKQDIFNLDTDNDGANVSSDDDYLQKTNVERQNGNSNDSLLPPDNLINFNHSDRETWSEDDDIDKVPLPELACEEHRVACRGGKRSFENIIDLRALVTNSSPEYSFYNSKSLKLWCGPVHWHPCLVKPHTVKCKNLTSKEREKVCLNFKQECGLGDVFGTRRACAELPGSTLSHWNICNTTTIKDEIDPKKLLKYFHSDNNYCIQGYSETSSHNENLNERVDDQHRNDIIYEENEDFQNDTEEHQICEWQLVAPPNKVDQLTIGYAKSAKKINMKKLKYKVWLTLTQSEPNNILDSSSEDSLEDRRFIITMEQPMTFRCLCKELIKSLSPQLCNDITVPLIFSALLHVANERTLYIRPCDNKEDLLISADT